MFKRLIQEEGGQSLVEYGLILGLVSVALIAALTTMTGNLKNIFMEIASQIRKGAAAAGKK